ncbi:ABC transporter permease [Sporolactobacillus sp. THM19-2]|uniref:ABC transporter permease n=1 Tax=Sporolactobacillus sp. THM19-2 TaxID=2511171 RepID=UPI0010225725|nr:ABC transporter permease [Sporolactobacillus sp. THM19-2]RYL93668.1 ABC transporter permease [Sporolactobacillus sp. THM19-2]
MPVFKLCMKLFLRNWLSVSLYIVIFLAISIAISATSTYEGRTGFRQEKAKIAFIDEEKTPLTEGFRQELGKSAEFISIPDQTEKLQDALFFRNVTYIMRIPRGYSENMLDGGSMQIEKTVVPNSAENAYIDLHVRQYWNLVRLYAKHDPDLTQQQLAERLKQNLAGDTRVTVQKQKQAKTSESFSMYYFNFLSYTLSAVLILGISAVLMVFNKLDVRRRIFCSPIRHLQFNLQMFSAILLFAVVSLVVLVGFCFLLDGKSIGTPNMVYFILNATVFTACISGLSFLIGSLIKNFSAISAVANVLTLGPSFISGVFVPQEFLNDTVLKIASFTPTYWYVQANANIARLTDFSWESLQPALSAMVIVLIFTAAFIALALVIGKRKQLMS